MKNLMLKSFCVVSLCGASFSSYATIENASAESAPMRFDARATFGGKLVHGVELMGSADGAAVTEWDTTTVTDGWQPVTSGKETAQLCVLNDATVSVEGGRLTESVTWTNDATHVVRSIVVIPSGKTLTLTAGTVVKFCPGAGFFIEDGGKLDVIGAEGADVILTSVSDTAHGAVVDCGEAGVGNPGGIQLQSSAATLADNNYLQTYGFTLGSFATVSVNDTTAIRNGGVAYVVLDVSGSRTTPFSVDWEAVDETAHYGEDYTLASGTVTWSKVTDGRKTLSVPLVTNNIVGETRTFKIKLTTGHCANIGDGEATVTIVERDSVEMAWGESSESVTVRFDARETFGGKIVYGTEGRGEADGSAVQEWDTTTEANGWQTLTSGDQSTQVYVMNEPTLAVEGGCLTASVTWANDVTHVVRSWVIVPSGIILTLTEGTVVKFAPGTGIFVEDGGKIDVVGAVGADVLFTHTDDDTVGVVLDCGAFGDGEPAGFKLQTSAATLSDNGFMQVRGFNWGSFPSVSVTDTVAFRSDGQANVTFTLSGATRDKAFSLDWVAVDDTAKYDEDYTLARGSVSWNKSSEGSKTIQIPLMTDHLTGENRQFKILIKTAHSANIADGEAIVEVREYNYLPIVSAVSKESAVVRFDTRTTLGGCVVYGTESIGEPNGSDVTAWETTLEEDGWQTLTRGTDSCDLFVLNDDTLFVEGGRLTASTIWSKEQTHLLRSTVVIPSGMTLTVSEDTVVKFCPNTQIFVEDGGKLNVVGAEGADVILTAVNDDTVGAVVACGEIEEPIVPQIQLQSSSATFTDNGYIQTCGFTSAPGYGTVTVNDALTDRKTGMIYLAFTVTGSRNQAFSIDWVAVDETAKYGEDYLLNAGTLTWNKTSEGTKWIAIPLAAEAMTGERRQFQVKITTARGVIVADGEAIAEIQELDEVKVVDEVTLQTSEDSLAFFVDGEIASYPVIDKAVIDLGYSPRWQKVGDASTMRAVVTLENEALGVKQLVDAPMGETGYLSLDLRQLIPGYYTLKHTIYNAKGEEVSVLKKVFSIVDPETTVLHGGTMTGNEVWETGKTHLVYKDVIVPATATILLEPGAIVKFVTGTCIDIQTGGGGAVFANGVIFTHVNDDTVGGDTLSDGFELPPVMDSYQLLGNFTIGEDSELRYQVQPPLSGTISTSRMLSRGSTYRISGDVTIASGATLTIPQGTILKFDAGKKLTVNSGATLIANGTRAAPIVFTSVKDDSVGGDTNGDGDATLPQGGDWMYVYVQGVASLNYVKALYGAPTNETGILETAGSGQLVMEGCTIAHAKFDGIWNWGGSITAKNCAITDVGVGVSAYQGYSTYINCVIDGVNYPYWFDYLTMENCVLAHVAEDFIDTRWRNGNEVIHHSIFFNPKEYAAQTSKFIGKNGNVWGSPMFVDPENGDFRTQAGSACIDAADGSVAPLVDAFGQPRFDILEVENTGTSDEEGQYPDIGIYEAMPRDVVANIDLSPQMVTATEDVRPGGTIAVRWTILNQGGAASEDSWRDTIYLVSESGQTILLGTKVNSGVIAAGGSYAANAYFTVPAIAEGIWYPKVIVNAERDIYEGTAYEDNVLTGENPITITLETSEVSGTNGVLTKGTPTVLKFIFDNAGSQVGRLNLPEGAKVYYGVGFVPSATANSGALVSTDGELLLTVPEGAKDVYILIEDSEGAYDITFGAGALEISNVSPNIIPKSGTTSLVINGAGFTKDATVELLGNGQTVPVVMISYLSSEQLIAQVNGDMLDLGCSYQVRVMSNGSVATFNGGVQTVDKEGVGVLESHLIIPDAVRAGRKYTCFIEYANTGNADLLSPVLQVGVEGGGKLDYGNSEYLDLTALQFMGAGQNGNAGVLLPGESCRIPFTLLAGTSNKISLYTSEDKEFYSAPWTSTKEYLTDLSSAATRVGRRGQDATNFQTVYDLALAIKNGEPTSAIYGRVVGRDEVNLVNQIVALYDDTGMILLKTSFIDEYGRYAFTRLFQSEYKLRLNTISGENFGQEEINAISVLVDGISDIECIITTDDVMTIEGRIENFGDVVDATVTVKSLETNASFDLRPTENGMFSVCGLQTGYYLISADSKDYHGEQIVSVDENYVTKCVVSGQKRITINGFVKDFVKNTFADKPVVMAHPTKNSGMYSAMILTDGSFVFNGIPSGEYNIFVSGGVVSYATTVVLTETNDTLILSPTGQYKFFGVVCDAKGYGLSKAEVRVYNLRDGCFEAKTDDNGCFEIKGLENGVWWYDVSVPSYTSITGDFILEDADVEANFNFTESMSRLRVMGKMSAVSFGSLWDEFWGTYWDTTVSLGEIVSQPIQAIVDKIAERSEERQKLYSLNQRLWLLLCTTKVQSPHQEMNCSHNREKYNSDLREYSLMRIEYKIAERLDDNTDPLLPFANTSRLVGNISDMIFSEALDRYIKLDNLRKWNTIYKEAVNIGIEMGLEGAKELLLDVDELDENLDMFLLDKECGEMFELGCRLMNLGRRIYNMMYNAQRGARGFEKNIITTTWLERLNFVTDLIQLYDNAKETAASLVTWFMARSDIEAFLIEYERRINEFELLSKDFNKYTDCCKQCFPEDYYGNPIDLKSPSVPQSIDPNEMVGSLGAGNPETERLVLPGEWLDYTIYFENKSDATAAAQEVLVTLPLSDQLDWSTFTLGEINFNNQIDLNLMDKSAGTSEVAVNGSNYKVRTQVVYDEITGVAQWYLRIVDPTSADGWPIDPYAGFLPPNDPETHCGEGHLTFRVQVVTNAEIGAVIDTSAEIVFDYNAPIITDPAWWNVVGFADSSELDWVYTIHEDRASVTITGLNPQGVRGSIEIPAELEGLPVTAIGEGAFQNHEWISSMVIPKSVETIGANAFAGCARLATIMFLGDPPTLGANAFAGIANPCTGNYFGSFKSAWTDLIGDDGEWSGLTMVRLASVEPELKWRYYDGTGTYFGQLIVSTTGDALKGVDNMYFTFEDRVTNTTEGVVATLWDSANKAAVAKTIPVENGGAVSLRAVALPEMVVAFQSGETAVTNGVKDLSVDVIPKAERTLELFSRRRVDPWTNTAMYSASLMCVEGVTTNYYALTPNNGTISAAEAKLLRTPTAVPLSARLLNTALALRMPADPDLAGTIRIESFTVTDTALVGSFAITATTAKTEQPVTQLGANAKLYIYGSPALSEAMTRVQELTSDNLTITGDTLTFEVAKPKDMCFFQIYLDVGTMVE